MNGIPFLSVHIAESVLNRIANTLEELPAMGLPVEAPPIADVQREGAALTQQLELPLPAAGAPPGQEPQANAGLLESVALGGSPLDGAVLGLGAAG